LVSKKSIGVIIIVFGVTIGVLAYTQIISQENESTHNMIYKKQNPYVEEFSLPADTSPNGIIVDKQGAVWVAAPKYQHSITSLATAHAFYVYQRVCH